MEPNPKGVFETIRFSNGGFEFLSRHMDRMRRGLLSLGMAWKSPVPGLRAYVKALPIDECAVRVSALESGIGISHRPIGYAPECFARGFSCAVSSIARDEGSPTTYIKSVDNRLNLAQREKAVAEGYDEAVFLNSRGELCEGSVSNLFFLKDGVILTPEVSCGLLPGIVREVLMEMAEVEETRLTLGDLGSMDGCFLTNSLMGVMPVRSLGGHTFDPSLCNGIMRMYDAADKELA